MDNRKKIAKVVFRMDIGFFSAALGVPLRSRREQNSFERRERRKPQRTAEGRRVIRLELEPQTNLPFASGQHLPQRSERAVGDVLLYLHGSGILAIEDIEKLKQRLKPHALSDIETLRKAQIEIDVWRRGKEIATSAWTMIDRIKSSIAIRIFQRQGRATDMESTLRAENAADLKLPRKL